MTHARYNLSRVRRGRRDGFTLAELLVVMGLLALLGLLTAFSAKRISNDAKLSSATNAVVASLSNARAYAIRNNTNVMVVFRPVWDPENPAREQQTEIVFAKWTGLSHLLKSGSGAGAADDNFDIFEPIEGILPRRLSAGIKVAGPQYARSGDEESHDADWFVPPDLKGLFTGKEAGDSVVAVMFAPDGTVVTRNSKTDSNKSLCDFNADGFITYDGFQYSIPQMANPAVVPYAKQATLVNLDLDTGEPFDQWRVDDEPVLTFVPFLAVFDETDARTRYDVSQWDDWEGRKADLSAYINQFANRIHFNRYTGVVMRQES